MFLMFSEILQVKKLCIPMVWLDFITVCLCGGHFSCSGFDSQFLWKLKQENNKLNFKAQHEFEHTQLSERKYTSFTFDCFHMYFHSITFSTKYVVPCPSFYHLPICNCKQHPMAVINDSVQGENFGGKILVFRSFITFFSNILRQN